MASTDSQRGEIWLTALGSARAGEAGKTRPAVVVSVAELLAGLTTDLVAVVPLSSSMARSRLRPVVPATAGLDRESVAICRAVRGVSRSRLLRRIGRLEPSGLSEIERALALTLGL